MFSGGLSTAVTAGRLWWHSPGHIQKHSRRQKHLSSQKYSKLTPQTCSWTMRTIWKSAWNSAQLLIDTKHFTSWFFKTPAALQTILFSVFQNNSWQNSEMSLTISEIQHQSPRLDSGMSSGTIWGKPVLITTRTLWVSTLPWTTWLPGNPRVC